MNKVVKVQIRRHQKGIKVWVKVNADIEAFFRQWGGGVEEAPTNGRMWMPIDEKPLRVWSFETDLIQNPNYSLQRAGGVLIDPYGEQGINISFLRLIGASEGRRFVVTQPMSTAEMDKLTNAIGRAAEQFYLDFIRPVNIDCYVGVIDRSRENGGGGDGQTTA